MCEKGLEEGEREPSNSSIESVLPLVIDIFGGVMKWDSRF